MLQNSMALAWRIGKISNGGDVHRLLLDIAISRISFDDFHIERLARVESTVPRTIFDLALVSPT